MFKVICDVRIGSGLEIKGKVYNQVIGYGNCKPCFLSNYQLTQTSLKTDSNIAAAIAKQLNSNALNPANPNYKNAYDQVLAEEDLSVFKYIALFEDNKAARNDGPALLDTKQHKVVFIYGSIVKDDSSIVWKQYNYILFNDKPQCKPGILEAAELQGAYVIDRYFFNFIKDDNFAQCVSLKGSHDKRSSDTVYGDYVRSIEAKVQKDVDVALSQVRTCKVNGQNVGMLDAETMGDNPNLSQQQFIEDLCTSLGGVMTSKEEALEKFCSKHSDDYVIAGSSLYNVTCGNYMYTLFGNEMVNGHFHNEL